MDGLDHGSVQAMRLQGGVGQGPSLWKPPFPQHDQRTKERGKVRITEGIGRRIKRMVDEYNRGRKGTEGGRIRYESSCLHWYVMLLLEQLAVVL